VIIDIIDPHSPFQSQWKRRMTYYKKCTYSIENIQQGEEEGKEVQNIVVADENGCLFSQD
jgi:hypothetical protein